MNDKRGTQSNQRVTGSLQMTNATPDYRNSALNVSSEDDDEYDDVDAGTISNGSPGSLTHDPYRASIMARAADQALNMLVDVSAQAEAKILNPPRTPVLDLEKQIVDLRERVIREQGIRSNRAIARAGLAGVTLKENLKMLERLCMYEDTARLQIPATSQNLQSSQRIEQHEIWSNVTPDEVALQADQLADNAQAQFLALTDRLQRYTTRESEAKFRMLVHRCPRIAFFLNSFRMAHMQRTELYERIFGDVLRRLSMPAKIDSNVHNDIARLIQMEKHIALSPRVLDQAEEYMEQEMLQILQPDILYLHAEPRFSRLISQFEELASREQQKLQAVKDSEQTITNAYCNAFGKFVVMSEADRGEIISNPSFKQQGEECGEFQVSDRDRRAALKFGLGAQPPIQPMMIRLKEQAPCLPPIFSKSPTPDLQYNAAASAFKPTCQGTTIVFPAATAIATAASAFLPARAGAATSQEQLAACEVNGRLRGARTGGIPAPVVPVPAISNTPLSVVSAAAQAAAQAVATSFHTMPPQQKPIPKGFTSLRCPTSTDQVTKIILACSFDDGERFEFYHMSYVSKNQKELEFPYSPTQQLSVVIPDHLFVVDSICECMSTIPETVVSLKSKKKSFFRALTNLGFAHKMQAKRMKKFQKQAWCATLPGTMQWIKRVRSFSTNTLHIDDLELERLIQFIEMRVVPILENWQSIEQVTITPLMADLRA